jgi:hypothetical protein
MYALKLTVGYNQLECTTIYSLLDALETKKQKRNCYLRYISRTARLHVFYLFVLYFLTPFQ